MSFIPGDNIAVYDDRGNSRPYSIASGVDDDYLRLLIRCIPGGQVSSYLAKKQIGDQLKVSSAFGWFHPGQYQSDEPFIFIATSAGIAPFLSYLCSTPYTLPQQLLYGVRCLQEGIDRVFLHKHCDLWLCISRENHSAYHHGRVTDLLPELRLAQNTHVYLCGLGAMIEDVSKWLENYGIDLSYIHREVFFEF